MELLGRLYILLATEEVSREDGMIARVARVPKAIRS